MLMKGKDSVSHTFESWSPIQRRGNWSRAPHFNTTCLGKCVFAYLLCDIWAYPPSIHQSALLHWARSNESLCLEEAQGWWENISVSTGKDITSEGWLKKVLLCPRRRMNMTDKNSKLYLMLFLSQRKDKYLRQLHILFGGLTPFQFVYCIQIFQLEHSRSRALYIFSSAYD